MLGKLLKYEFKAMGRKLLPLYGALIIISMVLGLMFRFSGFDSMSKSSGGISEFIAGIMILFYVVLMVVICIMTLILIVQRFSKNLMGSEGYMMMTLPATSGAHIWNKTISATVWTMISTIAGIMTLPLILITSGAADTHVGDIFAAIGKGLHQITSSIGSGNLTILILEVIILIVITSAEFALQIYASISIGHQVQNHKGLCSVGAFIGTTIIESVIQSVIGINKVMNFDNPHANVVIKQLSDGVSKMEVVMLYGIISTLIFAAIYFVITKLLMDYKLNLE